MSVEWGGPFASTTLPAGQQITGWSEGTTAAAALKTRYRDGDPASAFVWREMYGNVNYHLATSRRVIWIDEFVPKGTAAVDPAKEYKADSWAALGAIYAILPRVLMTPSPRLGDYSGPYLSVRISARNSAAAAKDTHVRVFSVASDIAGTVDGWTDAVINGVTATYVDFAIDVNAYPASPGWSTDALSGLTELTLTPMVYSATIEHPAAAALDEQEALYTTLVLACVGDDAGTGPLVRAIQVRESVPGA